MRVACKARAVAAILRREVWESVPVPDYASSFCKTSVTRVGGSEGLETSSWRVGSASPHSSDTGGRRLSFISAGSGSRFSTARALPAQSVASRSASRLSPRPPPSSKFAILSFREACCRCARAFCRSSSESATAPFPFPAAGQRLEWLALRARSGQPQPFSDALVRGSVNDSIFTGASGSHFPSPKRSWWRDASLSRQSAASRSTTTNRTE